MGQCESVFTLARGNTGHYKIGADPNRCTLSTRGARLTSGDAVVHHTQAMHSNLFGCSLDVLQLVLCLHAHILNLADRLINVGDLRLLRSLHSLRGNLQSTMHRDQALKLTKCV